MAESKQRLLRLLKALMGKAYTPSQLANELKLPKYEVLGMLHALEALGIVTAIYRKGNIVVYVATEKAKQVIEELGL